MTHAFPEPLRERQPPADSLDLVSRAKAGDTQALNHLLVRYQERILRIARIRLGAELRRFIDSVDILNQANVVVVRKLDTFEPRDQASIIQWLARIVENQIREGHARHTSAKRDMGRDLSLQAVGSESGAGGAEMAFVARDASPSTEAARAEMQALCDECLQELSPEHREVILLRDYNDGSWEFVCSEMGRPSVHATQELYRRAQIKLARLLKARTKR